MPEEPDWSLATWEGNRLRQHREFLALPFRQKLEVIEGLGEVASFFAELRSARAIVDGGRSIESVDENQLK